MEARGRVFLLALALAGTGVMGLRAQKTPQEQTPPPELQAMMEARRRASEPGPQHLQLMLLAGDYATKDTYYLPGAEPETTEGAATLGSEMGERFLVEHHNGAYHGEPYVGLRIYGYNNGSKQYEGVWAYNGSTGLTILSGNSKDGGKTIDFTASRRDNATGKPMSMAITLKVLDPDHFEVEQKSTMPDGSPGPRVVSDYTRKI